MESNDLLKTLYKRINELSNTNIISVSNAKEATNEKTEKIKKDGKANNNSKDPEESNKALNSLVDKLIRKFDFEKQDDFKAESDLVNTKIYKNLMKKYAIANEAENESGFTNNDKNNKNTGFNIVHQDEKINRVIIFMINDIQFEIIKIIKKEFNLSIIYRIK